MIMFTIMIALFAVVLIAQAVGSFSPSEEKYYNPLDSTIKEWRANKR